MASVGRPAAGPPTSRPRTQRAPTSTSTHSGPPRPSKRPQHSPMAPARPLARPPHTSRQPSKTLAPTYPGPEAVSRPLKGSPRAPHRPGVVATSASSPNPGSRSFTVGIEAEFFVIASNTQHNLGTLESFVKILAYNYNEWIPLEHPRMRESVRPRDHEGPYIEWCLTREDSITSDSLPWGLELVSPIFRAFSGSTWRKDVDEMWKYLEGHYKLTANDFCGTHIHIGQEPGFKMRDLKRIAQAAIHFETAFEVLVPEERRGNPYAKSNWLNGTGLGEKNLSRSASIAAIEAVPDEADLDKLLGLLQPIDPANPYNLYDRAYCWNFLSLYKIDSIEFRKPPASLSSIETLSWAELALSFVQASTCGHLSSKELQKIPPNVGGLRGFLTKYGNEPGLNQTARLNRLFRGTKPGDSLPSVPILGPGFLGLDRPGSVDLVAKAALDRMHMRQREAHDRTQNGAS